MQRKGSLNTQNNVAYKNHLSIAIFFSWSHHVINFLYNISIITFKTCLYQWTNNDSIFFPSWNVILDRFHCVNKFYKTFFCESNLLGIKKINSCISLIKFLSTLVYHSTKRLSKRICLVIDVTYKKKKNFKENLLLIKCYLKVK